MITPLRPVSHYDLVCYKGLLLRAARGHGLPRIIRFRRRLYTPWIEVYDRDGYLHPYFWSLGRVQDVKLAEMLTECPHP